MKLGFQFCKKMAETSKTFLFWFSNEHSNFRVPELESLFRLFSLDMTVLTKRRVEGPFIFMDFPDEEGPKRLMSRSVLVHSCYEVWSQGRTLEMLHLNNKKNIALNCLPYVKNSFQVRIETYGKTIKHREKLEFIETFDYLPFEGKVNLTNPECSLHLVLYYGLDPNNVPENPQMYFGRWVTDGQRKLASKISLKDRKFIGNTSMDPLLSLLMANLAQVKQYDMVFDPFVGTGSLLVASAVMGGYVMGSDIDYLMLHGKTPSSRAFQSNRDKDESIRSNLKQYGVEGHYLDILVADASRIMWRQDFRFDAIITDPPYGIRESTERIGSLKIREPGFKIKEEHLDTHYPAKIGYSLTDIFCDLLNFSAKWLEINGKLVFWIPISRTEYDESKLPMHPCLSLISNDEQVLTSFCSRRLLTFEKTKEPTADCKAALDGSALMYRFKFMEADLNKPRQTRKTDAYSTYGKLTKRGQLISQ